MKLSLTALVVFIFASGALSEPKPQKPGINCQDPYFAGFQDIPGIASLCNNAVRPTSTVTQSVTGYSTITSTITVTNHEYTEYRYTTPTPTATRCPTTNAAVTARMASPSAATLVRRDDRNGKCKDCLPIAEGITSACSCFFTAGPQQTVTQNQTVAVETRTETSTTYVGARTRTLAEGCQATNVPVYGNRDFAVCGAQGIQQGHAQRCYLSTNNARPFSLDALDCCTACANTLDCFGAYTDSALNTCELDIRIEPDGSNTNLTADCPNFHTFERYGDLQGYQSEGTYFRGSIAGHCSQGC